LGKQRKEQQRGIQGGKTSKGNIMEKTERTKKRVHPEEFQPGYENVEVRGVIGHEGKKRKSRGLRPSLLGDGLSH